MSERLDCLYRESGLTPPTHSVPFPMVIRRFDSTTKYVRNYVYYILFPEMKVKSLYSQLLRLENKAHLCQVSIPLSPNADPSSRSPIFQQWALLPPARIRISSCLSSNCSSGTYYLVNSFSCPIRSKGIGTIKTPSSHNSGTLISSIAHSIFQSLGIDAHASRRSSTSGTDLVSIVATKDSRATRSGLRPRSLRLLFPLPAHS